jgi:hypothetical protein
MDERWLVSLAWLSAVAVGLAGSVGVAAEIPTAASWIWYPERPLVEGAGQTRYLRKVIHLAKAPAEAWLRLRADDAVTWRLNGEPPPTPTENGNGGERYDLTPLLQLGENVFAFTVLNTGGPGGLIVTGTVRDADGTKIGLCSDASYRTAREPVPGWDKPGFDDGAWLPASIVGNAFCVPWYGHPAFDMAPFIEPADQATYNTMLADLVRLPDGLASEPPVQAALGFVNGSAALTLNGVPRPALIYRGTVDPLTTHGRRQIAQFRDAGIHVYAAYLTLADAWGDAPDRFSRLDNTLRAYLAVDPDAMLVLLLSLVPPDDWMDQRPDELVRYAMGADYNSADEAGRVRRPSLASEIWRRDALAVWQATIAHLEAQPWGKRVIGYHPCYGIYAEWHYYGSWLQQMPDTGPAMTTHFRTWLRQRYGTDERLRTAWADPTASLDTAAVPGVGPRLQSDRLGLRDPARQGWVTDYYRCQQEVTAADVEAFCRVAKEATRNRVICGAFYGYFQGVLPQTQGGHLELERLLRSPYIDYFTAPYDYSYRLMGEDGRTRAVPDAFPAAGKVHLIEADTRTHLHPVEEYGRVANTAESIAAIRREMATALTHGSALWWCDFGAEGGGGWYDHPELLAELSRLNRLATARLQTPRRRTAQVVVVADLKSCYALADGAGIPTHYGLVQGVTSELYHTGTPFDSVLLSQLDNLDLSACRVLIFLNTLEVPPALRPTLAQLSRERTVLWLWAPGISDGTRLDPELVQALTGFRLDPASSRGEQVTCEPGQPLTATVPATPRWSLAPRQTQPVAGFLDAEQWFNPRDAETMAAHYTAFAWRTEGDSLRWDVATSDGWTDIHLKTTVAAPCDGFTVEVSGNGGAPGLGLRLVIKDADAAEFAAPALAITSTPQTTLLPLAAFGKAPWSRATATAPRFPLSGVKFVLNGAVGNQPQTVLLRAFASVQGDLTRTEIRQYGEPGNACPVLSIADPQATVLGRESSTGAVLLASRGEPGRRQMFSALPFVPRQILAALLDEAGVQRYTTSPEIIVRADSGLVALHTKDGGRCDLRLPRAATVSDALTGAAIGQGERLTLDLPPTSTTLLRLE